MEKKTISVGIIGAGGFIGQEHLKRLTKLIDGAVVTALYDINKEKTDALAAEYGAESMESVDALIASDKVDAIVITAWDGVHAEVTNKAIAAGKPVFCEKPLATTKADCAEIVRNEKATGKNLVQVGFMRRFDPDYCKIKAILDSGELGKPLMAHCISRTPRIAAGFTNAMQVTNVLIHEIDQFRWLFGEELVRGQMLAARNTEFAADGLNDPQLALMWTESNILIDVECSVNSYYGYEIGMEIVCERAPSACRCLQSRSSVRASRSAMRSWTTGQSVSPRLTTTSCSTGSTICAASSRPQVRAAMTASQPAASRMR